MIIKQASFIMSNTQVDKCPEPNRPEYAFIGRSNVGKSSLINMLVDNKKLAKTSGRPGKTQLINHFDINEEWYLVDLPGYGYAKTSKSKRKDFHKIITRYLTERTNLLCTFVLLDSRLEPQKIDLEFMEWLGEKGIPFAMVFTKVDKIGSGTLHKNQVKYKKKMLETWESLPPIILTSATSKAGREETLSFIQDVNQSFEAGH